MEDKKWIRDTFDVFMMDETEGEPLAGAILVLALAVTGAVERLDTIISRGIRHGLFGADADPSASIDIAASRIEDGLTNLRDAVDDVDRNLSGLLGVYVAPQG